MPMAPRPSGQQETKEEFLQRTVKKVPLPGSKGYVPPTYLPSGAKAPVPTAFFGKPKKEDVAQMKTPSPEQEEGGDFGFGLFE